MVEVQNNVVHTKKARVREKNKIMSFEGIQHSTLEAKHFYICLVSYNKKKIFFYYYYYYTNSYELLIHEETGHTLPSTDAHARQQDLFLLPPALTQPSADLPYPSCSQRMTQGDRSSSDVHFRMINLQRLEAVYRHRSESLVYLNYVNISREIEVQFRKKFGDCNRRTDAHDSRSNPCDSSTAIFRKDGLIKSNGF